MEAEKVLGLILDMTLEHHQKRRLLDVAKEQIIRYIRENFIDDDQFYLYHPQVTEVLWRLGEQVAAVGNYGTDGWKFDLEYALKQTLYVVGAEDVDSPKLICVISNRQRDPWLYKKLLKLNDKDSYGCNVLHVAVGESGESFEIEDANFRSVRLDDPELIVETIKEMEYGRPDDLYCQTGSE